MKLTHFDEKGATRMVDVGNKKITRREATAGGRITMAAKTLELILEKGATKGEVLETARLAGIMAAKRTHELIPLCHAITIDSVTINFKPDVENSLIDITAKVTTNGRTGVEMDALTAVTIAALTIFDMVKAVDKEMTITKINVIEKIGGQSGHYIRKE
ncbi:MAG TPA: cyclic pyranopterin monophosphate synthase MoaC [Nitrospinota bacterium]|nr:cyclic pyranopterin monophosphate synthase MoaC [Nitrospinota bacterium]